MIRLSLVLCFAAQIAVLSLAFGWGCSATQRPPGEALTGSECSACHLSPDPGRFSRSGWEDVLREHTDRVSLSPEEADILLEYLSWEPDRR